MAAKTIRTRTRPIPKKARRRVFVGATPDGPHAKVMRDFESLQITDPFESAYGSDLGETGAGQIIPPPYNPASLQRLPQENNILRQCIDAMVTNVEGFGYRLEYIGPEGAESSAASEMEATKLSNFLDQPNDEMSHVELRERVRRDLETFGNGYYEGVRNARGEFDMIFHLPGHLTRIVAKDREATEVPVVFMRAGVEVTHVMSKHFRRYVQQIGSKKVYFKEFGDPRIIDPATGVVTPDMPFEEGATEVIHLSLYSPGQVYGMPRWLAQLPSILGSRQMELTNLDFFKENAIPALALLVSGGVLTEDTIESVEHHFTAARGRESMNRVLTIEAESDPSTMNPESRTTPVPRLDMKPLAGERQQDALFLKYDEANQAKIRTSFRIPPIFVGRSDDYTRATAGSSMTVAENQIFGPERNKVDDMFNDKILAPFRPVFWRMRSLAPQLTDPEQIVNAISSLNEVGAMTPNVAIGLANELFDLRIPLVEDTWGSLPFAMTQAALVGGKLEPPEVTPPGVEPDEDNSDEVDRAVRDLEANRTLGVRRRYNRW